MEALRLRMNGSFPVEKGSAALGMKGESGMGWRDQKVAVIGLGVSNIPLIRYLAAEGARITVCDRQKPVELESRLAQIAGLPVSYKLGEGYLEGLTEFDTIFLSPGIPKDLPEIAALRGLGIRFSSEMEVFFELCPAPIVGITGSSGKTTTTTLVGEILKSQGGRKVFVGGNIGNSLLDEIPHMSPEDLAVLELSSFQLENLPRSPRFALMTNITPNHLDVHKRMEAYIKAKRRILDSQNPHDFAVLNYDNDVTRSFALDCPGQVFYFSRLAEPERGAFLRSGMIVVRDVGFAKGCEEVLCPIGAVRLLGVHNWENVLAAVTLTALCGAQREAITKVIASFTGVPHRLELVAEVDGVKYYNDSIATSPARAVAGINALHEPLVLIAGGYDKQLSFEQLAETVVERVKAVVLVGAAAAKLEAAIRGKQHRPDEPIVCRSESFDDAVQRAAELAAPGDVVLLSPACASYDMFRNFEERGERFREIVRELAEEG
jgi:UDP-N-acetylmuramoylalanine--D-glutamate ligase